MEYPQLKQMYELEDSYWWFVARRRLVCGLIARYAAASNLKILDAGAGTGALMQSLANRGEVWGCDTSAVALEFCRKRGLERLVQCSVEQMEFADASFDVVTSLDVIEHVGDDRQAVGEMYRVLRPGGLGVMTVPALKFLWSPHDEILGHLRRYHRGALRRMLRAAGFKELRLTYVVSLLMPLMVAHRWWLRIAGRGAPRIGITPVPVCVDRLFRTVQHLESLLVHTTRLPWGASLVAVVRKPEG